MSSSSENDRENSTSYAYYMEPQSSTNGHDPSAFGRQMPMLNPYTSSPNQMWPQRDTSRFATTLPSPSPSSSRPTFSGQPEPSRFAGAPFTTSDMSSEARRQSIMAMDRKRRLTGSAYESGRRRNTPGDFNDRDEMFYSTIPEAMSSNSRQSRAMPQFSTSSTSNSEVVDLTNSPPSSVPRPTRQSQRTSSFNSGVYVVPRWQPDSEVSECPICKRPFSFLFRRHHCRKCGRVVCNDCSPHRITIPRQFIVNVPGPSIQTSPGGRDTVDLTGEDEDDNDSNEQFFSRGSTWQNRQFQNPAIGGGEKVRLCNPCVPDPQPEPVPEFNSSPGRQSHQGSRRDDLLSLADALRSSTYTPSHMSNTEPFPGFAQQPLPPLPPHPGQARPFSMSARSRNEFDFGYPQMGAFSFHTSERRPPPLSSSHIPQSMHHRYHSTDHPRVQQGQQSQQPITRPRHRSMLEESYMPRMFSNHPMQAPRPRLNEDDYCPICRRALPPKGVDGDETAREAHVMECISSRDPSTQASNSRNPASGLPQSPPRGPIHMLPFIATEKDCLAEDGNPQECSICMVEYDVGDQLARLECLCKFHRECISEWFTRKQECPVHKIA